MSLKIVQIVIDDSSDRLITGRNEYSRSLGGVLVVPGGTAFPTSSFSRELFWNALSGTLYVRNEQNTDWIALGADQNAAYVTMGNTGSLPNERALTAGSGITVTDGGSNSTVTVGIDDRVTATVTGTLFTGPVSASAGLSGSLQQVAPGLSYLVGGAGITVSSASNGQVTVANAYASIVPADSLATYLVLNSTASLPNERVLNVSGSVLSAIDTGPGGTLTLDIANTGTAGTYGEVAVNAKGQVTSGSTSWFGQNFWFVSGSSAQPFINGTATYLSAISLTASNLTPGIYRFGWSYTFYARSTTNSFRARCFIINSASYDTVEEMSELGANERNMRSGFAYVRITGSVALFSLDVSMEALVANVTASVHDRALELWRVS